jgi:hypothetical protein
MVRPIVVTTLLMCGAGSSALNAQRVELQVLGGQVSDESGAVGRGLTLAPAVAWAGKGRWLRLEGRGTALEGGGRLMGAGAGFYLGHLGGPIELGASGSAGLLTAGEGFRSVTGELSPGLRVNAGAASVGAGIAVRAASLSSAAPWRRAIPFGGASASTVAAQSIWAEARTGADALSIGVIGRVSRADGRSWREANAGASLHLGKVSLSGFVGARLGDAEGRWGGAAASVRVAPGVELLAQLAQHASDPLTGQPGGRTAAVGVSLSRGSLSASTSTASRTVRLALRAAPGARVELLGDWNDWRPEPVTDQGGGVFAGEVRLPPGVYHFVFRVNGQLRVPEGYETAPDDFGGRSAVVRVRG